LRARAASANRIVLLSEARGGLRWRKTYELREHSNVLELTVELENRTLKPVTVSAASVVSTAGELIDEGATQRAWADGQWLSRRLVAGPTNGDGFHFEGVRIDPLKRIRWTERWWLQRGSATTRPADPADSTLSSPDRGPDAPR
jgi:hypothetical protein